MSKNGSFLLIFIIFLSSCYLGKCPNKADFIKGIDEFAASVENDAVSNWESKDKVFYQYMNECYELYAKDLTNVEKSKIWLSAAKYYTVKYNGRLDKAYNEAQEKLKPEIVEDFVNFMKEYPKEALTKSLGTGIKALSKLLDGVSKNIKPELEKLGEELEKTTKELSKELEKVGEQ